MNAKSRTAWTRLFIEEVRDQVRSGRLRTRTGTTGEGVLTADFDDVQVTVTMFPYSVKPAPPLGDCHLFLDVAYRSGWWPKSNPLSLSLTQQYPRRLGEPLPTELSDRIAAAVTRLSTLQGCHEACLEEAKGTGPLNGLFAPVGGGWAAAWAQHYVITAALLGESVTYAWLSRTAEVFARAAARPLRSEADSPRGRHGELTPAEIRGSLAVGEVMLVGAQALAVATGELSMRSY